jgi:hypothetical protein
MAAVEMKKPIIEEKDGRSSEAEAELGTVEDISKAEAADGDDALKFAGTHAHKFDEEYMRKLRRKIVGPFFGLTTTY